MNTVPQLFQFLDPCDPFVVGGLLRRFVCRWLWVGLWLGLDCKCSCWWNTSVFINPRDVQLEVSEITNVCGRFYFRLFWRGRFSRQLFQLLEHFGYPPLRLGISGRDGRDCGRTSRQLSFQLSVFRLE